MSNNIKKAFIITFIFFLFFSATSSPILPFLHGYPLIELIKKFDWTMYRIYLSFFVLIFLLILFYLTLRNSSFQYPFGNLVRIIFYPQLYLPYRKLFNYSIIPTLIWFFGGGFFFGLLSMGAQGLPGFLILLTLYFGTYLIIIIVTSIIAFKKLKINLFFTIYSLILPGFLYWAILYSSTLFNKPFRKLEEKKYKQIYNKYLQSQKELFNSNINFSNPVFNLENYDNGVVFVTQIWVTLPFDFSPQALGVVYWFELYDMQNNKLVANKFVGENCRIGNRFSDITKFGSTEIISNEIKYSTAGKYNILYKRYFYGEKCNLDDFSGLLNYQLVIEKRKFQPNNSVVSVPVNIYKINIPE